MSCNGSAKSLQSHFRPVLVQTLRPSGSEPICTASLPPAEMTSQATGPRPQCSSLRAVMTPTPTSPATRGFALPGSHAHPQCPSAVQHHRVLRAQDVPLRVPGCAQEPATYQTWAQPEGASTLCSSPCLRGADPPHSCDLHPAWARRGPG